MCYLESVFESLLDDGRHSGHVFVGRVGAAANQAVLHLEGPAILLGSCALKNEGDTYLCLGLYAGVFQYNKMA